MQWKRKDYRMKKKFAFFPELIKGYYIWLEYYYISQRRRWDHWHATYFWETEDYTTKEEYLKWKGKEK